MSVLYVSPSGQDNDEGTANFPLRTISKALQQARPGSVVQLAPGTYQENEQFPLVVPDGVTVAGDSPQLVTLKGGGKLQDSRQNSFQNGPQNSGIGHRHATIVLGDRAQLREVTVTNPDGIGIVTAEGAALIVRNRLTGCQQHGLLIMGQAQPFVSENEFVDNGSTGLSTVDQAKGEVRQNRFTRTGEGISLRSQSAPLVIGNQLTDNRCGISIGGFAQPVLRQNKALSSQETGLWTQDRAQPDIGQPQDLGGNWFEGKIHDIRNDGSIPLTTAGNQINPVRVSGRVDYLPSEIPDESAVPAVLLGNVEPSPLPADSDPEPPAPDNTLSLDSRFNDLVGHWSAPFVEALADKGLVKGFLNGTFKPDNQVTRAQFAALVAAAFPTADAIRPVRRFPDVPAGFWAARAIRQAQTTGFISGFPDGSFRPDAPLTRVQAMVALVNGLGLGEGRSQSLLIYGDRAQVPSYAIEAVAAATDRKMVVNYPDPYTLRPLAPISRAETTALVHQALVAANKTPRIDSPFIAKADTAAPNFSDLSPKHWAADYIEPLVEQGWLSGFRDGTFQPDSPMTRAQFAVLLVGAFDPKPKRPRVSFRDVPDSFWGAEVIQQAYQAEFISGFPDLTFDPNQPLTKLQALLALSSGLELETVSPPRESSLTVYRDRASIPQYAKAAIAAATQLSLVFNHPIAAELRPNRTATRAEVSAMVYQSLVVADRMPPIASRYQVVL
ncbi:MAG: S-layer homology domain-containing protein [Cyanobacteria bacterium J06623_4]